MTDLQALLAEIDRLDKEAIPGPWIHDEDDTSLNMDSIVSTALGDLRWIEVARSINHDTEFIALARTALPQLANALRAVLDKCEMADVVLRDRDVKPDEHDVGKADMADDIRQAITDAMEAE